MLRLRCLIVLVFMAFSGTVSANGKPAIIYDSGDTVSIRSYMRMFDNSDDDDRSTSSTANVVPDFGREWIMKNTPRIEAHPNDASTWLPLHTTELTPGLIGQPINVDYSGLKHPICIVGADRLSYEWMVRARQYLLHEHAQCWVVEAPNIKSYDLIQKLMINVLLLPADGNAIAKYFKIKHYPVLISERGISQ